MKFPMCFTLVVCLVAFHEIFAEEEEPQVINITPKPHITTMTIGEFHECVSCQEDKQARADYDACRDGLSAENKAIMEKCCLPIYDKDFNGDIATAKIDYDAVCKNPSTGLDAERCFWQQTNKEAADIEPFRNCKKQILDKYCTTKSEE